MSATPILFAVIAVTMVFIAIDRARRSHWAEDPQTMPAFGAGRIVRVPCDPMHVISVVVALGPDPKQLLSDFGGAATLALIFMIFAETGLLIGFFLPGDSLLFTAGLLAAHSKPGEAHLNLAVVLLGCFAAAVIGDQVGYTIGDHAGPRLRRRPDSKLFKRDYVLRTEAFFDRHGPKTILLARFVPVVRTFAPLLAGVAKMTRRTFTAFNVVGAAIWVFGVTLAGYFLADALGNSVDTYLLPIIFVIVLVSLIPPLLKYRKANREGRQPISDERAATEAARLRPELNDSPP
jgi:membrane-associated protein